MIRESIVVFGDSPLHRVPALRIAVHDAARALLALRSPRSRDPRA